MKSINSLLFIALLTLSSTSFGQISGNQVYGNSNYNNNYNAVSNFQKRTIYTTDSTLTITANILLNKIADEYILTIGANQEAKTVIECNTEINKRISNLMKKMETLGITSEDVYIDFISQTKVYDYIVQENDIADQYQTGFEIKKNLIIKLKEIERIDQLIEFCAEEEIHDIIKVDYINSDIDGTYLQMYEEAIKFIEGRKSLYTKTCNLNMAGTSHILSDNFSSFYPANMYRSYVAYESSNLNVYQSKYDQNFIKKEERKSKTFYYSGISHSSYDKIINASNPKVGIQYVLNITIVYDLGKDE